MRSVTRRSRRRGRLAFGFALALLLTDPGTGAATSILLTSFLAIVGARLRGAVVEAARDKTRDVFDSRFDLLYRKVSRMLTGKGFNSLASSLLILTVSGISEDGAPSSSQPRFVPLGIPLWRDLALLLL
ncbi:hypothetical protein EDB84DRAFT_1582263 [Lactarius hengduanensis]|nr:hypothetical protein EDB84DRAFT_1582263 [Lactarius hengduanensis]